MVPAQQYQALHDALALVQFNGQAIAAADLVLGTVITVRDRFSEWSVDNARRWAHDQLADAVTDVQTFRAPLAGDPNAAISQPSWDDLMHAIERAYNVLWNVQDTIGDEPEWKAFLAWVADTATGTISNLPQVIKGAVHFTADLATDTVGGVAAGLLPLWPIVAVAVAVAMVGAYALVQGKKRGLL